MRIEPKTYDIEMPTGHYVDVSDPAGADIRLEDIAHKLAQTNRFGGATYYPYPVAQHAVLVSRRMEALHCTPEECFAGLHHDDGEYIATDIQKPIKMYIEAIVEGRDVLGDLESDWQLAIESRLELPPSAEHKARIKESDVWAVLIEAKNLLPSKGRNWRSRAAQKQWKLRGGALPDQLRTPAYWRGEMYWREARDEYLVRHYELKEVLDG